VRPSRRWIVRLGHFFCLVPGWLGFGGGLDGGGELGDEVFALGFAHVYGSGAAGKDEVDVRDADEAQYLLEVAGLCVVALHVGAGGVDAAGGEDDGELLALEEAFVGGGEGLVDADDVVDVGLEDGGGGEVVHGGAEDDVVGSLELGDELVGDGEGGGHLGGVLLGGGVGAGDPGQVDEGEGGGGEVAGDDGAVRVGGFPGVDEGGGELARDGVGTAGAGDDGEECGHGWDLGGWGWMLEHALFYRCGLLQGDAGVLRESVTLATIRFHA
jgi:hypothetical protein